MSDEAAFIRAICAEPADDAARLAYADWLQEHGGLVGERPKGRCPNGNRISSAHLLSGDGERCLACGAGRVPDAMLARAEFIRVQVECSKWSEEVALSNLDTDWKGKGKRERQLLTELRSAFREWLPSSQPYCHSWSFYPHRHEDGTPDDYTASLHNGFLYKLTCGAEWFLQHADALVWHPKQTVVCRACGGTGGPYEHGDPCSVCGATGKVPRPCPPTAQPIRRVRLTTMLENHLQMRAWPARWPGVTFELLSATG